jgi:hypothetical protein
MLCTIEYFNYGFTDFEDRDWSRRDHHFISRNWDGDKDFLVFSAEWGYRKRFWPWTAKKLVAEFREREEKRLREFHGDEFTERHRGDGVMITESQGKRTTRAVWKVAW